MENDKIIKTSINTRPTRTQAPYIELNARNRCAAFLKELESQASGTKVILESQPETKAYIDKIEMVTNGKYLITRVPGTKIKYGSRQESLIQICFDSDAEAKRFLVPLINIDHIVQQDFNDLDNSWRDLKWEIRFNVFIKFDNKTSTSLIKQNFEVLKFRTTKTEQAKSFYLEDVTLAKKLNKQIKQFNTEMTQAVDASNYVKEYKARWYENYYVSKRRENRNALSDIAKNWDLATDAEKDFFISAMIDHANKKAINKTDIVNKTIDTGSLAYTLGWLAGHLTSITGHAPYKIEQYVDQLLSGVPGYDECMLFVDRSTIESYIANNTLPPYALSLVLCGNTKDSEVPVALTRLSGYDLNSNGRSFHIANTSFITDLLLHYSFNFTKRNSTKLDIDSIKRHFTNEKDREQFELGLNAKAE